MHGVDKSPETSVESGNIPSGRDGLR
jgi:hypothetical protein